MNYQIFKNKNKFIHKLDIGEAKNIFKLIVKVHRVSIKYNLRYWSKFIQAISVVVKGEIENSNIFLIQA